MSSKKQKPIIIAESNFLTGRLLAATLQSSGYMAIVAPYGEDVMKLLDMYSPDVLLLNMNLSRPSGVELLRTLQTRDPHLKILASTAAGQSELKASATSLGVRGFFEMPFCPDELTAQVHQLIAR
jgi:DNA-binding response OmpR family regulator